MENIVSTVNKSVVEKTNSNDVNFINLSEDRIFEYKEVLKTGVIEVLSKHYKTIEDKRKDNVLFETRRIVEDIQPVSYRDKKNLIFRCKLVGKIERVEVKKYKTPHIRRGHLRTLKNGVVVWTDRTMINEHLIDSVQNLSYGENKVS